MNTERQTIIDAILAAARRPCPEIVEKRELEGTDGRWRGANGFPHGVAFTGRVRLVGYVYQAPDGATYGQRGASREELQIRHADREDRSAEQFRRELEAMSAADLGQQADYWLPTGELAR